jgi:hypothetical protein
MYMVRNRKCHTCVASYIYYMLEYSIWCDAVLIWYCSNIAAACKHADAHAVLVGNRAGALLAADRRLAPSLDQVR